MRTSRSVTLGEVLSPLRSELEALRAQVATLTAERDDGLRVIRELRQKLAIAGVEGSPPPGAEETTIGGLLARARAAEAACVAMRAALTIWSSGDYSRADIWTITKAALATDVGPSRFVSVEKAREVAREAFEAGYKWNGYDFAGEVCDQIVAAAIVGGSK